MGQTCSICEPDRSAEVNLGELGHAPLGEGLAEVRVPGGTRQKKEKKEKKEKKSKKGNKEPPRAAEAVGPELGPPAEEHGPAPRVPPIRLMLPLGAMASAAEAAAARPCMPEDGALTPVLTGSRRTASGSWAAEPARQQAMPAAPQGAPAGPGQHGARRWSTLPSVGTWLKPLPRSLAQVAAAAEAEAGVTQAADAVDTLQVDPCSVTRASSVESFVALAAGGLEAGGPEPLCEQPDLIELFGGSALEKAPAPKPAVEGEAPSEDRAAQEAFLAKAFLSEALAWPAADKEHRLPFTAERAAACEPPPPPQAHTAGAATAWHLRPSVGTWLHAKVRPLPPAPKASCPPDEEPPAAAVAPDAAPGAARAAAPPEAGSATTAGAIGGRGALAADVEVSYGRETPSSWQKEAPLATPAGGPGAGAWGTTTTTPVGGTTTDSLLSGRIISM